MDTVSPPAKPRCDPPTAGPQAQAIASFLDCKRIALVGISHRPDHFSRTLLKEMLEHGLDVELVNPNGGSIDGRVVHESLAAVSPAVDGVYVATPAASTLSVMQACTELGITRIWLHKGGPTDGAVSPEAVEYAAAPDRDVVIGQCLLMFLEPTAWVHRAHRGLKKAMGSMPV